MEHPPMTSQEVGVRGRELYERLRSCLEVPENVGKLVSIDVETGDYEVGDDRSLDAPRRLREKHPGAAIFTTRIGYNAAYAIGGVLERTSP